MIKHTKITYFFERTDKKRIKKLLKAKKIKQNDIANLLGLSVANFSLILNGKRAITPELLEKLEKELN